LLPFGQGVAAGRLFAKFHKGATPAADATPGTGLGLFIVRQVMENVGGSVAFEPRLPHGAHFHLALPLYPRQ